MLKMSFENAIMLLKDDTLRSDTYYESLKNLGNILRDESARQDDRVKNILPIIVESLCNEFENLRNEVDQSASKVPLEELRVLINMLADSDTNRQFITKDETLYLKFWNSLLQYIKSAGESGTADELYSRILILLSQFVRNTALRSYFASYFQKLDFHFVLLQAIVSNWLKNRLDFFEDDNALLLIEISSSITENISKNIPGESQRGSVLAHLSSCLEILQLCLDELSHGSTSDQSSSEEALLQLCEIIVNLTMLEDISGINQSHINAAILGLFCKVPKDIEDYVAVKRHLFSASGNVSSMSSYDNWNDVDICIDVFYNGSTDPYLLSAASIVLGNAVSNATQQKLLFDKVESRHSSESLIRSFFATKFNDIIQLQSFHLLNNIMSERTVDYIIVEKTAIFKAFKAMMDNEKYYKEVSKICYQFLKKMLKTLLKDSVSSANSTRFILESKDLWNLLRTSELPADCEEVYLLLARYLIIHLDAIQEDDYDFVQSILAFSTNSKNVNGNVSSIYISEKIKNLSIVIQELARNDLLGQIIKSVYRDDSNNFDERFLKPLHELLVKFRDFARQSETANTQNKELKIIINNLKFLCASTLSLVSSSIDFPNKLEIEHTSSDFLLNLDKIR
ncbi:Piso0_005810 [Millerozyma farinosa CBS 7064]|uniref:Piso0_005810 protein n=1 Tax=Pichia sorbitophila (strain ATCC MYA-4447 / BCRC 22081 / CBS 7064 / NBRC 10061 / NRRL Y-12695) TaxID=559304 RepID=G8Y2Z5_PICSO|nr:Piso0_005810 [Millerozyma farinosa CBS 7064]